MNAASPTPPPADTPLATALGQAATPRMTAGGYQQPRVTTTSFDKIPPTRVRSLWPNYLAVGRLVPLVGDGGAGKGYILMDLAARVSRGRPWPDESPNPFGPGDVFILESEDNAGDTLRTRLDQQDADLSRVHLVHAAEEELRPVNLGQDLEELKARISEAPAPRLLIVSALNDYLPAGVNPDKDIEIRRVLRPLSLFAEQCGVALCCLLHVGKATDRKAQHRQLGSVAYMNLPRIALGAVAQASAEGPTLGIFGGLKNNLGKRGPSLCYRITDTGLQWDGPSPVDIKNAMQQDGLVPSGPGPGSGRPPKAPLVNKVSNFHPVVDIMTAHEAGRAAAAEVCLDLADVG